MKPGNASRMIAAALALTLAATPVMALAEEQVKPSAANAAVRDFDDPNLVFLAGENVGTAPLAVFMPGTGGRSETAPFRLLGIIKRLGYNVIYLTYNDIPAVSNVCPSQGPSCSALFRESRVLGGGRQPIATPAPEAIVQRLTDLLHYLDRQHPEQGWGAYLDAAGAPVWPRILLSGLSQGAGMAAYMAQRFPVQRVVLFSSPWDVTGQDHQPAPWLYGKSVTPPERWWAERHKREKTTELIAHAYDALRIPREHILLFDGDPGNGMAMGVDNPYHSSTVRLPQYTEQWRILYGQAPNATAVSAPDPK
jgi:hypothetical protein